MEHKDHSIVDALRREKTEEVGESFKIRTLPYYSIDTFFTKNDGNRMILPHHYAVHVSGDIQLNEEYSEYTWVPLPELKAFGPKISNISWITPLLAKAASIAPEKDFILL
jgi:8-oxo-dGTP pyrophosphatase MutT (NUDIX family)